MDNITVFEGDDLNDLMDYFGIEWKYRPYRVRIWGSPNGQIKIKVNEGMWSPLIGKKDK
jgi:hypothetical protein